jgi:ketosteroid isomerase-like protein
MSSNLETIQETYSALAEGNIDTVMATFADDITWIEAEGGPYGGEYHGPDDVLENVFARLDQEWDDFRAEPERFIDAGDTIVTTGTYSGTYVATGRSFEAAFTHVWDLEDGQVVRFQQHVDTALHNEPLDDAA